jgi:hypothetical protein
VPVVPQGGEVRIRPTRVYQNVLVPQLR